MPTANLAIKDVKDYNYVIKDGVLVIYSEDVGICYYGNINEEDEIEDTINELYEEGILCIDSFVIEEKGLHSITNLFKRFYFCKR